MPARTLVHRSSGDAWRDGAAVLAAAVTLMWTVELVDLVAGDLDSAGIRPRDPDGLVGIVTAPFLHGGFGHLISNTVPLLLLGGLLALSGAARVLAVTAVVAVVGGAGTWLTGPEGTVHIGASGLVFGYAAYLVARGAYSRRLGHIAGGMAVVVLYGLTLLGGLIPAPGVSWQGHLFGALGGVVAAAVLHRRSGRAVRGRRARG